MWCALRPHYGAAKAWCEIGRPMALRKCAGNAFLGVAVREIVQMAFMAAALLEYTGRHFLAIMLHLMVFAHKVESNCCLLSNVSEPIWKACLQVIVSMSAPALTRVTRSQFALCRLFWEDAVSNIGHWKHGAEGKEMTETRWSQMHTCQVLQIFWKFTN